MDHSSSFAWTPRDVVKHLWGCGAKFLMYTDGGFRPATGVGASAWILHAIIGGGQRVHVSHGASCFQGKSAYSSTQMELIGVREALKYILDILEIIV